MFTIITITTKYNKHCIIHYLTTGEDRPTIKDLNNHVIEQYAIYWKQLGVELGVQNYHIANITENNASRKLRQVEECCSQMLQKWLDIDPSATWGKLDDAIKKIKLPSTTSPVSTDKGGNHWCKLLVTFTEKDHIMISILLLLLGNYRTAPKFRGLKFS